MERPVVWSRQVAIDAGNRFVEIEGRLPRALDFRGARGINLPYEALVRREFGSVRAYVALLRPPPPRVALEPRPCNNCEGLFTPARRHLHSCPKCKLRDEWRETGDYLNGEIITWRSRD